MDEILPEPLAATSPRKELSHLIVILIILVMASATFVMQKKTPSGILVTPLALATQKKTTAGKITEWTSEIESIQKYQVLFRSLILKTARLHPDLQTLNGFFNLYFIANILCLALALFGFYLLLRELHFNQGHALLGCLLFLTCYPIIFSHQFPVNSRGGDFLAYFFVSIILINVLRDRALPIILFGIIGTLAKENVMIAVLPFLFLSARPIYQRCIVILLPIIGVLIPRFWYGFPGSKIYLSHYEKSLEMNFSQLGQTLIFVAMTFGCIWLLALRGYFVVPKDERNMLFRGSLFFGLPVLAIVTYIHTGAFLYENRILFILFPWILIISMKYIFTQEFKNCLRTKSFSIVFFLTAISMTQFLNYVFYEPNFVGYVQNVFGTIFEPGFQLGKSFYITKENGLLWLNYNYQSSPWTGIYLWIHVTMMFAYLAGMCQLKWQRYKNNSKRLYKLNSQ